MTPPGYSTLYQINTRVWLRELASSLRRSATFDDIPDSALDRLAESGFDWIWLLGVWQIGPAGRQVSLSQPQWRIEYKNALPDFQDDDVCGSPFAVRGYTVDCQLGTASGLRRLRQRLRDRGLRLLLDFVPNHTALDHPWVAQHPEYYVHGTERDIGQTPQNFSRLERSGGHWIIAHGRDPYFPGWPDTLQLNFRHAGLREAMTNELQLVADQCDGVRCDMAMLVLPEVAQRTWSDLSRPADGSAPVDAPFWPEAIALVRQSRPEFVFMAEVYWDLEWELQQEGFDFTYDKRLYDRLHARDSESVRKHLWAELGFQRKLVRFLENHDEPRAASAFPPPVHKAAAVLAFLIPGMRFFHEGQLEGRRIRVPMHMNRRQTEDVDADLQSFYGRLLTCLRRPELRSGDWRLLECGPAWSDNTSFKQFIAFTWQTANGERLLVAVNYGHSQGQCYVYRAFPDLPGKRWRLRDLLSAASYERDRDSLALHGLYLDMPAWEQHVFELTCLD
jgi:hypothetical protein